MCKKSLLMMLLLALLVPLAANAQTSLWSEDFEDGTMPEGWTTDGSGTWTVGTGDYSSSTGAGNGSYNAKITHGTTGNVTKLITPEIDLSSVSSAELSFMHVQRSWSGDIDQLRVYYRTSSSGSWNQLVAYTGAIASWTTESGIVLPDLSSTYQLAFEHTDKYGYGVGVDNIVIVQGAACPKPAGLAATLNGQSVTLTWASDATSFSVAYSMDATATPADNIVATVNSATYTMNDLTLDEDHYFWVRANCSGTEQSDWSDPVSVHVGYCTPAPTSVDGNGISNVTFGIGENVVNNDTPKATYADYSNLVGAVQAGIEATIAITFKTGYTYNTFVWVDLNNSLSFEADEVVCYGESTSNNPTTLTLNFTIPATQTLGDFRLRIGSADSGLGSNPAAANPCYSSSYGCFQDYTLRVLAAPSCLPPTGLAASNVTAHEATISWTSDATAWQIQLGEGTPIDVTEPTYTFTGLAPETAYSARVRANCDGVYSDWTNPVNFTTTVACVAPSGLAATLTSGDGTVATLTWTENGTATEWDIEYGTDAAFETYTTVNASGTPSKELTGLTPETTYYARVKAYCGSEDGYSSYSNVATFTPTDAYFLTVNDGSNPNSYVPIFGTWVDNITKSQFIIPAENLADMAWGTINKMTFYAAADKNWGAAQFEVYMTETAETTLSALADYSTMTKVMNAASLGISGNQMVVEFDTPYQYSGGNLMIGFLQTVSGTWNSCSWYGVTAEGASMGGYGSSISQQNFLPKTTFTYEPGEEPSCMWPTDLAVSNIGGRSVELSWTENGEATTWNIGYQIVGEEEQYVEVTENPYTLTGLTPETDYEVRVQSKCSDTEYSVFTSFVSFTTGIACIAPTGLVTSDIFGHGATITWTAEEGAMYQCALAKTAEYDPENINWSESFEGNTQSWTNLDPETGYTFALRKDCGSEDGYSTVVTKTFTTDVACHAPTNVTVSDVEPIAATVNWEGTAANYNLRYRHAIDVDPSTPATIILEAHDVWQDGSGYQMLLDADATAFGDIISESGPLTSGCDGTEGLYEAFEYLIPADADASCAPENFLFDGSVTIEIPAGTYDWCIVNPSADDRIWIAGEGDIAGRYDDYVFEPGVTYHFTMQVFGTGDGAALEIIPTMSDWTVVENATNPYALTNLIPETYYEVQVQAVCGGEDGESLWASANFTTPSACDAPNGLEATNVEATTATLGWTGYQDSYNVRYRTAGFDGYYINETFDGEIGNWTVSNLQSGSGFISGQGVDGSICFGFKYTYNPPQYLISPELRAGVGGKTLTFSYRAYSTYYAESFKVGFATGEETSFEEMTWEEEVTTPSGDVEWHEYQTTVPEGTSYFVIQCTSYDTYYLFVDNFVIYSEDDIAEPGEWIDAVASTNSLNITGLTPETNYEFQVQGINPSCEGGLTEWSEMATFTTPEQTTVTQTIALSAGTTWVSFYVDITLDDLKAALVAALPAGNTTTITIASQTQAVKYQRGRWAGQLTALESNQMYMITVSSDCEIALEDMLIDPTTLTVNIVPGGNWIAYPYTTNSTPTALFAGFAINDDVVRSQTQSAKYNRNRWGGQLTGLVPNQGYIYVSADSSSKTFAYPALSKADRNAQNTLKLSDISLVKAMVIDLNAKGTNFNKITNIK